MVPDNSWNEWKIHILSELKRYNDSLKILEENYCKLAKELAIIKVKAGFWGLFAGMIPPLVYLIIRSI